MAARWFVRDRIHSYETVSEQIWPCVSNYHVSCILLPCLHGLFQWPHYVDLMCHHLHLGVFFNLIYDTDQDVHFAIAGCKNPPNTAGSQMLVLSDIQDKMRDRDDLRRTNMSLKRGVASYKLVSGLIKCPFFWTSIVSALYGWLWWQHVAQLYVKYKMCTYCNNLGLWLTVTRFTSNVPLPRLKYLHSRRSTLCNGFLGPVHKERECTATFWFVRMHPDWQVTFVTA